MIWLIHQPLGLMGNALVNKTGPVFVLHLADVCILWGLIVWAKLTFFGPKNFSFSKVNFVWKQKKKLHFSCDWAERL